MACLCSCEFVASVDNASKSRQDRNFSIEEKELLLELITDKVTVLECKLGDINSTKRKKKLQKSSLHGYQEGM